jgi:hypothetical protein
VGRPKGSKNLPKVTVPETLPAETSGTVAGDLARLDNPITQALGDVEQARSTWALLQPLATQVIEVLRSELETAIKDKKIPLATAQKLIMDIASTSKTFAATVHALVASFERLVEVKETLGGGHKRPNLETLSETELRKIIRDVAKEYRLFDPHVVATVEAS